MTSVETRKVEQVYNQIDVSLHYARAQFTHGEVMRFRLVHWWRVHPHIHICVSLAPQQA